VIDAYTSLRGRVCPTGIRRVYRKTVKDWEGEEEIKAQLRELTDRTRKLREDLTALVRPATAKPTRAFIHRQAWPATPPVVATARERKRPARKKR
jgi:hypothetical protein